MYLVTMRLTLRRDTAGKTYLKRILKILMKPIVSTVFCSVKIILAKRSYGNFEALIGKPLIKWKDLM